MKITMSRCDSKHTLNHLGRVIFAS